jgi:general L-amino acid transport system substrate-binding protein
MRTARFFLAGLTISGALVACAGPPAPAELAPALPASTPASVLPTPTHTPTAAPTATAGPTHTPTPAPLGAVEQIRARGRLRCGVAEDDLLGLSVGTEENQFVGLAADYCRAVAAATLGDAEALEFRPLAVRDAGEALRKGLIDLLSMAPVISDEAGLAYSQPLFYDGVGLLAPLYLAEDMQDMADLRRAAICVVGGSPEEQALIKAFLARKLRLTTRVYSQPADALTAYDLEESCTALAGRRSELAATRYELVAPLGSAVADLAITSEPWALALAPADPQWAILVQAVVSATLEAERLGLTSENLDDARLGEDVAIRRIFFQNTLAPELGLQPDFLARVIEQVGNYGQIYARNLGPDSSAALPRASNGVVVELEPD